MNDSKFKKVFRFVTLFYESRLIVNFKSNLS